VKGAAEPMLLTRMENSELFKSTFDDLAALEQRMNEMIADSKRVREHLAQLRVQMAEGVSNESAVVRSMEAMWRQTSRQPFSM
jgi:hypothetical protein